MSLKVEEGGGGCRLRFNDYGSNWDIMVRITKHKKIIRPYYCNLKCAQTSLDTEFEPKIFEKYI